MLLWLLLLILTPGREQSGIVPKAFIFLNPPWSPVFNKEKMILTCKDVHSPGQGDVLWYKEETFWKRGSEEIQVKKSGSYKCKTRASSLSDPVHVEFLSDKLILQASHPIFEGEDVHLRCLMNEGLFHQRITDKWTYYKNGERLGESNSDFILNSVSGDNSQYHCTTYISGFLGISEWEEASKPLMIQVQELFPQPVLTISPLQPIEGSSVTLKCETWLPPRKYITSLQFCFFQENQTLGSGWSSSSEFYIPVLWSEDSGSYWCQAQTTNNRVMKSSLRYQIHVQRVPISAVKLEIQPPEGQRIEGENLFLTCSVAQGTGAITFSWHREGTNLGRKTQRSLSAELQIPSVKESDAGRYYCTADNSDGPILSQWVRVTLKIPVSCPVLTLGASIAQYMVGDLVELHCDAQRGSPPIQYQFYHENVTLWSSTALSGGGVSFKLSLTEEHSGNYYCEADNGLGSQSSDRISLNIIVPVSRPILTLRAPQTQAMVGDVVELHCEAQRGSPPILYQFYHGGVHLGNSSALAGGGASFNFTLTFEHSANFSCEADNELGTQSSVVLTLNITGTPGNKTAHISRKVTGGLLSALGLAALAILVGSFRIKRRSGNSEDTDVVYSLIWNIQQAEENSEISQKGDMVPPGGKPVPVGPREFYLGRMLIGVGANGLLAYLQIKSSSRMHQKDNKEPVFIYSEIKKVHTDDSDGQRSSGNMTQKSAAGDYENVLQVQNHP
ncbi:Fc receptor-like protein 3 [Sorex araneus]|uniref:Fc receptor-like protein 3 n=1 Tax=Sorex araneus TaxID=42254 RepID=UPI0024335ED6|nr:Fc receptor-like protein 3 [Sorex araneus]